MVVSILFYVFHSLVTVVLSGHNLHAPSCFIKFQIFDSCTFMSSLFSFRLRSCQLALMQMLLLAALDYKIDRMYFVYAQKLRLKLLTMHNFEYISRDQTLNSSTKE